MDGLLDTFDTQLSYFSAKVVMRFPPASVEMIDAAESKLSCQLSPQYRAFLQRYNGIHIVEVTLFGVPALDPRIKLVSANLVKVNTVLRDSSLDWPNDWLCLGGDGFGNFYVASLHRTNAHEEYPILFVEHDTLEVEHCDFAAGYFDFLFRVLTQMHTLYLPNGRLKELTRDLVGHLASA